MSQKKLPTTNNYMLIQSACFPNLCTNDPNLSFNLVFEAIRKEVENAPQLFEQHQSSLNPVELGSILNCAINHEQKAIIQFFLENTPQIEPILISLAITTSIDNKNKELALDLLRQYGTQLSMDDLLMIQTQIQTAN